MIVYSYGVRATTFELLLLLSLGPQARCRHIFGTRGRTVRALANWAAEEVKLMRSWWEIECKESKVGPNDAIDSHCQM